MALALCAAIIAGVAGVLTPTTAAAVPGAAGDAAEQVRQAAQQLTTIDEQMKQAEETVAARQDAAAVAAAQAAAAEAALAAYEPQLRAIAQTGYTGATQSRVAAFLTSDSADDLIRQMTTLDMIATHTNSVVSEVAAAQAAAQQAQAAADEAAATARAGLEQLEAQQAEVEQRVADYQADFAALSGADQTRVTTALAGPTLAAPTVAELPVAPGSPAAAAIDAALAQVGDAYVWGGAGPDGFDCSGLTAWAYAAAGVKLPHSSKAQAQMGVAVSRAELQPGDLVYFYEPISHIALYIGDGKMVHARTFGQPVSVTSVDMSGYAGARRILS